MKIRPWRNRGCHVMMMCGMSVELWLPTVYKQVNMRSVTFKNNFFMLRKKSTTNVCKEILS